jgi:nucleoside-diphosphate-sugar epimerase
MKLGGMNPNAEGNLSGRRLVIFGCGYVGTAVARQAVGRGLRVTALTRNPATAASLAGLGIETVVADLAGNDWHGRIPGAADFVLNCVSSGGGGLENYRRNYVAGMQSVLTWARPHGVGTLVYTSSTSVYPQGGGVIVDENSPTEGAGESARVLLEAERLLDENLAGTPAVQRAFILRLAGIYGPDRHHLLDQLRTGASEIAGSEAHRLNLIHRDDIARAVWAAFQSPATVTGGIFNAADDGAATKAEIVTWLAAQLGVPLPRFNGEATRGRRRVTPDRIISNGRLKTVLGWRPSFPSFREGYAALLAAL